jgi:predicted ATPase/DNA-binding XRE family transcriptional regulator
MALSRPSSVGDVLRRLRLAAGLTQEQLADKAGLSTRGVSDIERGVKQRPHRDTLVRIADALQLGPLQRALLTNVATPRGSPSDPLAATSFARPDPAPPVFSSDLDTESPIRHNLPNPLSSFVGRAATIAETTRLLRTTRLLTLTGSGGCGKSRLAIEAARQVIAQYADGVWLVELAALGAPDRVAHAIAHALGVPESPAEPMLLTLQHFMTAKRLLIVLDNCEHLIDACAAVADALLRHCPGLVFLATSREPLRIPGELTYRVPSLSSPVDGPVSVADLTQFESTQLFVERAKTARLDLDLQPSDAPVVAEICRRLDGIPLAIELAAARVSLLTPRDLARRLDDRFRLLTGGSRTALARYQTLRASIDWSYALLSEAEQVAFRRLAVFAGSFSWEAAETVCGKVEGGAALPREGLVDLLPRLVDKSLVQADLSGGEVRFHLLETLREYAWERLADAKEDTLIRRSHLDWCQSLAAEVRKLPVVGQSRVVALERVVTEMANIEAALDWCLEHDVEAGLRLVSDLYWLWFARDTVGGQRWFLALLRQDGPPTPTRARAQAFVSYLVGRSGDIARARAMAEAILPTEPDATADPVSLTVAKTLMGNALWIAGERLAGRRHFEEGLLICRGIDEVWGIAAISWHLGVIDQVEGKRADAYARYAEALTWYQRTGDPAQTGVLLMLQGDLTRLEGRYSEARELLAESIRLGSNARNREGVSWSQAILGDVLRAQGEYPEAEKLMEESLRYYRVYGTKPSWSPVLGWRANLSRLQGHFDEARRRVEEALLVSRDVGNPIRTAEALYYAARLAVDQDDQTQGVRLLSAAMANGPMLRNERDLDELADLDAHIAAARSVLGDAEFEGAWADGQTLTLDQAVAVALGR